MKNTYLAIWPGGMQKCLKTNLLAFETAEAAKVYFARYCGSTQSLERIGSCVHCDGFHFASHESDESGKRPLTRKLPACAEEAGCRLSAKDTKTYAKLPPNAR